jgi:NAD-dependent dihydropyrimidine dehydrogenase PreA subunit
MQGFRYIEDVATLSMDPEKCTGCGTCVEVCPHAVFAIEDHKSVIVDAGACMECGACAQNCRQQAVTVNAGVGCAAGVIRGWIKGTGPDCGCSTGCC